MHLRHLASDTVGTVHGDLQGQSEHLPGHLLQVYGMYTPYVHLTFTFPHDESLDSSVMSLDVFARVVSNGVRHTLLYIAPIFRFRNMCVAVVVYGMSMCTISVIDLFSPAPLTDRRQGSYPPICLERFRLLPRQQPVH